MFSVTELSDTDGNVQGTSEYVTKSPSSFYLYIPLCSTPFSLEQKVFEKFWAVIYEQTQETLK